MQRVKRGKMDTYTTHEPARPVLQKQKGQNMKWKAKLPKDAFLDHSEALQLQSNPQKSTRQYNPYLQAVDQ